MTDPESLVRDLLDRAMRSTNPMQEARRMTMVLACGACRDRRPWELAKALLHQITQSDDPVKEMHLVRATLQEVAS